MRVYSAEDEEILRARELVKEWAADDGVLSKQQCERLREETVCDLRTTNIFLRLVLFFFTVIGVAAVVGLFFEIFLSHPSDQMVGVVFLFFAVACYAASEFAVFEARLHHFGIEEALAVVSVAFLCTGVAFLIFIDHIGSSQMAWVPAIAVMASLWIWYRFNLWYGFVAAMVAVNWLPVSWMESHPWQLVIVVGFYAVGLVCVIATAPRYRDSYLENTYSLAEAMLLLGIYLTLNLKISPMSLIGHLGGPWRMQPADNFSRPFYWATWVLIWCLPPVVLARGIRQKDRLVIAVGGIVAVLTLVTNKPYLGWQRHTWDPMLLGVALCGVVWFLRRWLAAGTDGVRSGFTADRLSGTDQRWLQRGSGAIGFVAPHLVTPSAQARGSDFEFGGGTSDGGGASGNF